MLYYLLGGGHSTWFGAYLVPMYDVLCELSYVRYEVCDRTLTASMKHTPEKKTTRG